jgi:hypothetical protein
MKTKIIPERIIPPSYTVSFYESREYSDYVTEDQPYDKRLATHLIHWLDHFAPGWSVNFDCGDWGEGPAMVTISFQTEDQAYEFVKTFNKIPCPNSESMGHCPHMSRAIRKIDRDGDGKGECLHCGHKFTIMTKSNMHNFGDKESPDLDPTDYFVEQEPHPHSSQEYVKWMAEVWRKNHERNQCQKKQ